MIALFFFLLVHRWCGAAKRQIDTKAGNAFFSSGVFIGLIVAVGVFFLAFGLVTLFYYLRRRKAQAVDSSDAPRAGEATATSLEHMKSAVYDPHAPPGSSEQFNPIAIEPSAIHQPLADDELPGTAPSNQYAKLPITTQALRDSSVADPAPPSGVDDEDYGQLELFKAAEEGGGASVNRDGYGIISKSLIKQPSDKQLKGKKKSKSKVTLDEAAMQSARANDDLMKSARHEYGSPNLPVVGQYTNTPVPPPGDDTSPAPPAAAAGKKVAFQTVAFGSKDKDDSGKPSAFKTVAFGGPAKPLPQKPAPAKPTPAAVDDDDDDVPAVTSKTVAFGKMPPKPTGGAATMAFGGGGGGDDGGTMFLPETVVLSRPHKAPAEAMQTAQENDDDDDQVAESRAAMKSKKKSSKKLKTGKSLSQFKSARDEVPAVGSKTVAFGRKDIGKSDEQESLPAIDL